MRWILTHTTNELRYWKMDQGEQPAELKYNSKAQSFRLTAVDKRLFFIERTGFLQSKYLIRTEYSQLAGEMQPGKDIDAGIILVDGKKFRYSLNDSLLEFASKQKEFDLKIEADNINKIGAAELCALSFSTLRVIIQGITQAPKLELA